jgi:hypothetical protein
VAKGLRECVHHNITQFGFEDFFGQLVRCSQENGVTDNRNRVGEIKKGMLVTR